MHVHASEWKRASPLTGPTMIACDTCSAFFLGCAFTGLALLQSSFPLNQCLAFVLKTLIDFLLLIG